MPAPYYLTKRGLSYEESTSIIGNKGLVNYVHDYDENLASKDKGWNFNDENAHKIMSSINKSGLLYSRYYW